MGISIAGFLEVSRGDAWEFAGEMVPNPDHSYDADEPAVMPKPLFESDHRELAAILAGVGNPIRSKEPFVPIAEARGLPPDPSPEVATWLGRWAADPAYAASFAASWCTARELLEFDWTGRIMQRQAMVDGRVAHLFAGRRRGFPRSEWPKDVQVSYAVWKRDGVEVEWEESYAEIVGDFYSAILPQLRLYGPPDDVRVVLSFD
jgi:hypothetical protein